MEAVTLIIAVVALVIAILAFARAGGVQDLRHQVEVLGVRTEGARDRTADILDRLERAIRGREKPQAEKGDDPGGASTPRDPR